MLRSTPELLCLAIACAGIARAIGQEPVRSGGETPEFYGLLRLAGADIHGRGPELDPLQAAARFDPQRLDCEQWVRALIAAGAEAAVLDVLAAEGFCLWPSDGTDADVASSPWRGGAGDVLGVLERACREQGLGLGISLDLAELPHAPPTVASLAPLRELLSDYGELACVRVASGHAGDAEEPDPATIMALIRELQPGALVVGETGADVRGVVADSHGRILRTDPAAGSSLECVAALRPSSHYTVEEDCALVELDALLALHDGSVGAGGRLSLEVPIAPWGQIPAGDVELLGALGARLDATYGVDHLRCGKTMASSTRPGGQQWSPGLAVDGDPRTHWSAAQGVPRAFLEVQLEGASVLDRVVLEEPEGPHPRIDGFTVMFRVHKVWREAGAGSQIGRRCTVLTEPTLADAVRVVLECSGGTPRLSTLAAYGAPARVRILASESVFMSWTRVKLESDYPEAEIRYTRDGSLPGEDSVLYVKPLVLEQSCILTAVVTSPSGPALVPARQEFKAYTPETLQAPLALAAGTTQGIQRTTFLARADSLSRFEWPPAGERSVVDSIVLPDPPQVEPFVCLFEGYLRVPESGVYAFFTRSDDGSRLFLDGELVVDNDGRHGARELLGEVGLKVGWHPLRLEYFSASPGSELAVSWRGPGISKQALLPGFLGQD